MTKLAPIKEFTKFGMRENRGLTVFNDVELELARQAIIRDFVSKLEPVGYCEKSQIEDVKDGGTGLFFDIKDEPYSTPLFDLTEWITK